MAQTLGYQPVALERWRRGASRPNQKIEYPTFCSILSLWHSTI